VGCKNTENINNGEPKSFSETQYNLVENGKSDYKIVVADDADAVEIHAAEELKLFIKESTNVSLDIKTETEIANAKENLISIGKTELRAKERDIEEDITSLEQGGVIIKTVNNNVFITGRTTRGTLNAVYKFLEYQIQFKAYSIDCLKYECHTTLKLLNFDYLYNPSVDLMVTNSYEINGVDIVDDVARMYLQAYNGYGGANHDGAFYELWCHTTELIIPEYSYGGLHPDWFGNEQLCFSNDEMMEQFAYVLFSGYVSTTDRPYIMIGAADKKSCCTCDRCKAEGALYGGQPGIFMRFMNKLAKRVEEYLVEYNIDKEIMLIGLNYYYYSAAPVIDNGDGTYSPIHESVVPKSDGKVTVGVCYAPISACFTHAFNDENCVTNSGGYKDLLGWATLTDDLFMYTYGSNFSSNFARNFHYNNWSYMAEQYKIFEQIGLDYIFDESCNSGASPLADMRIYVRSRLGWNPNVEIRDVMDEFMDAFYGVGASGMKEYFDAVMEHFEYIYTVAETECQGTFYTIKNNKYWPLGSLQKFQSILMNTINKVNVDTTLTAKEKQTYSDRIYKEYLILKVLENDMYANYFSEEYLIELRKLVLEANERFKIKI
jgi:hypothetical protein